MHFCDKLAEQKESVSKNDELEKDCEILVWRLRQLSDEFLPRHDDGDLVHLLLGWRPSLLGWRPSLVGWRPSEDVMFNTIQYHCLGHESKKKAKPVWVELHAHSLSHS